MEGHHHFRGWEVLMVLHLNDGLVIFLLVPTLFLLTCPSYSLNGSLFAWYLIKQVIDWEFHCGSFSISLVLEAVDDSSRVGERTHVFFLGLVNFLKSDLGIAAVFSWIGVMDEGPTACTTLSFTKVMWVRSLHSWLVWGSSTAVKTLKDMKKELYLFDDLLCLLV